MPAGAAGAGGRQDGRIVRLPHRLDWFGPLVNGHLVQRIADGQIRWDGRREASITRNELDRALRTTGEQPDPSRIRAAFLERDGSIRVIPRSTQPRIPEITVAGGVQPVRVALE